eukprot:2095797-Rhodomonas_salina.1
MHAVSVPFVPRMRFFPVTQAPKAKSTPEFKTQAGRGNSTDREQYLAALYYAPGHEANHRDLVASQPVSVLNSCNCRSSIATCQNQTGVAPYARDSTGLGTRQRPTACRCLQSKAVFYAI